MDHKDRLTMARQQRLLREAQGLSRSYKRTGHRYFTYLKQLPVFSLEMARWRRV
jgi:hypothetical protein